MSEIQLSVMSLEDDRAVYALVEREFMEFVQDDCTEEGVDMFFEAVRYIVYDKPDNYFVLTAKENGAVIGMIAVRHHNHISLFFVDKSHHRRGIGRRLFEAALARCLDIDPNLVVMDVHSSLYAVPVYEHLGFTPREGTALENGIQYVKMTQEIEH